MNRDRSNPGRQTAPAYSSTRRTWYGYGSLSRAEKSEFGQFLHDCSHIFGYVSALSLPVLFAIMATPESSGYGPVGAGLVAWVTMVVVGTSIRGGWVKPLATDTLGWVSITPSLITLRFFYYNLVLAVAAFGGAAIANATGVGPLSLVAAVLIAIAAMLAFPRLGESTYGAIHDRDTTD